MKMKKVTLALISLLIWLALFFLFLGGKSFAVKNAELSFDFEQNPPSKKEEVKKNFKYFFSQTSENSIYSEMGGIPATNFLGSGPFLTLVKEGISQVNGEGSQYLKESQFVLKRERYPVPAVALTFDDGPSPYTLQILKILQKEKAKATFFVIGKQAEKRGALLRRILSIGCEIGNHTYSHLNSEKAEREKLIGEILNTHEVVRKETGGRISFFRPPGAWLDALSYKTIRSLGYEVVLWDVDSLDWKYKNRDVIVSRVLSEVKPGSVILLHDGGGDRSATVEALPIIIKEIRKRGYSLVTLSELLRLAEKKGKR
jgi:peptidoglycan/xylan/chitin deacetylase (PgdA/CDA1 family)